MEKEIEELKNIVAVHFGALGFLNPSENEQILKDRDKVLNALNELQSIKESNASEALKCLKDLKVMCGTRIELDKFPEYNVVEQALLKSQELEKVLEIVKEKRVDIMWFCQCIEANRTFEDYNSGMVKKIEYLTKEEFDTLKRYFERKED